MHRLLPHGLNFVMGAGATTSSGILLKVDVKNLSGVTDTFSLAVVCLPDGWAHLERDQITRAPGEEQEFALQLTPTEYRTGIYNFNVTVTGARTGASESFKTVHVIGN